MNKEIEKKFDKLYLDKKLPFPLYSDERKILKSFIDTHFIAKEDLEKEIDMFKKALPLERVPKRDENTDDLIDEFMKLHYEPVHEEGQTCWCEPKTIIKMGVPHIEHNEQRILLREFLVENFEDKPSLVENLCFGFNECRRLTKKALQDLKDKLLPTKPNNNPLNLPPEDDEMHIELCDKCVQSTNHNPSGECLKCKDKLL